MLFELKTDTNYVPSPETGLNGFYAAKKVDNDYSHQIVNFYFRMFQARAAYEYSHADTSRATTRDAASRISILNKNERDKNLALTSFWLDKALDVDPSSQAIQAAKLQVIQEMSKK